MARARARYGRWRAGSTSSWRARAKTRSGRCSAQFGTRISPTYGGSAGPLHNQIPQPDRTWITRRSGRRTSPRPTTRTCCSREAPGAISMRNFYIEQSSNRYTVNGDVTDWVQVPFNEAYYGSNYCGGIVCAHTWLFVRDSVKAWYNAQIAAGKTPAEIDAYLASSMSGTATTTTATATSTSRMAISITSRPSTPARARRPAAARRAPTPSGATAGMRSTTTSASPARRSTRLAASRSAAADYLDRRLHGRARKRRRGRVRA